VNKKLIIAGVAATSAITSFGLVGTAQAESVTTLREGQFLTQPSDTRTEGHVMFGTDGLSVVTESGTSRSKAAEYWKSEMTLADAGEPALDWRGTDAEPGKQLLVDMDDDASTSMYDNNGYKGADAILVGEDVYTLDGKPDWWVPASATQAVKDAAPSHQGGSGSENHGTLDGWRAAFPHAKVVAAGFSLGSGMRGSGVISEVTVGDQTYKFTGKDEVVTPPVDTHEAFKVTKIVFDPSGDDAKNPNGEYVQVKNRSGAAASLKDYKLVDAGGTSYGFPDVSLGAGNTVTVKMGKGTNNASTFYRGGGNILNNDGDAVLLKRGNGTVSDACAYAKTVKVSKTC
jgi:hypothetical protein